MPFFTHKSSITPFPNCSKRRRIKVLMKLVLKLYYLKIIMNKPTLPHRHQVPWTCLYKLFNSKFKIILILTIHISGETASLVMKCSQMCLCSPEASKCEFHICNYNTICVYFVNRHFLRICYALTAGQILQCLKDTIIVQFTLTCGYSCLIMFQTTLLSLRMPSVLYWPNKFF